eukprot:1335619-Pleurochrysis_carterae.AAC.3
MAPRDNIAWVNFRLPEMAVPSMPNVKYHGLSVGSTSRLSLRSRAMRLRAVERSPRSHTLPSLLSDNPQPVVYFLHSGSHWCFKMRGSGRGTDWPATSHWYQMRLTQRPVSWSKRLQKERRSFS